MITQTTKTLRLAQDEKTRAIATVSTLKSKLPELDALFGNLEAGQTPNFLEMMSAISEMVAFYTNCDTSCDGAFCHYRKMS